MNKTRAATLLILKSVHKTWQKRNTPVLKLLITFYKDTFSGMSKDRFFTFAYTNIETLPFFIGMKVGHIKITKQFTCDWDKQRSVA